MYGPHNGFQDTIQRLSGNWPQPAHFCHAPPASGVASGVASGEPANRWRSGETLLASAWTALSSTRSERVDIHLRSGAMIEGALAVRADGAVGEASTIRGLWTHMFALEDVTLVHLVPRGGVPPR